MDEPVEEEIVYAQPSPVVAHGDEEGQNDVVDADQDMAEAVDEVFGQVEDGAGSSEGSEAGFTEVSRLSPQRDHPDDELACPNCTNFRNNTLKAFQAAQGIAKLQAQYQDAHTRNQELAKTHAVATKEVEECFKKLRESEVTRERLERDLQLAVAEVQRLQDQNKTYLEAAMQADKHRRAADEWRSKHVQSQAILLQWMEKTEALEKKYKETVEMVKKLVSEQGATAKKTIELKAKLELSRKESKAVKKHWTNMVRLTQDITKEFGDQLPEDLRERLNVLPLDELIQSTKEVEASDDSDDEDANELERQMGARSSSLSPVKKRGGASVRGRGVGRGGRGGRSSQSAVAGYTVARTGKVIDESMHEDLLNRKLHRNDGEKAPEVAVTPAAAASVMGKKTETVREQQERQRAGFKGVVAGLKMEQKAKQKDKGPVACSSKDVVPSASRERRSPSVEEELMMSDNDDDSSADETEKEQDKEKEKKEATPPAIEYDDMPDFDSHMDFGGAVEESATAGISEESSQQPTEAAAAATVPIEQPKEKEKEDEVKEVEETAAVGDVIVGEGGEETSEAPVEKEATEKSAEDDDAPESSMPVVASSGSADSLPPALDKSADSSSIEVQEALEPSQPAAPVEPPTAPVEAAAVPPTTSPLLVKLSKGEEDELVRQAVASTSAKDAPEASDGASTSSTPVPPPVTSSGAPSPSKMLQHPKVVELSQEKPESEAGPRVSSQVLREQRRNEKFAAFGLNMSDSEEEDDEEDDGEKEKEAEMKKKMETEKAKEPHIVVPRALSKSPQKSPLALESPKKAAPGEKNTSVVGLPRPLPMHIQSPAREASKAAAPPTVPMDEAPPPPTTTASPAKSPVTSVVGSPVKAAVAAAVATVAAAAAVVAGPSRMPPKPSTPPPSTSTFFDDILAGAHQSSSDDKQKQQQQPKTPVKRAASKKRPENPTNAQAENEVQEPSEAPTFTDARRMTRSQSRSRASSPVAAAPSTPAAPPKTPKKAAVVPKTPQKPAVVPKTPQKPAVVPKTPKKAAVVPKTPQKPSVPKTPQKGGARTAAEVDPAPVVPPRAPKTPKKAPVPKTPQKAVVPKTPQKGGARKAADEDDEGVPSTSNATSSRSSRSTSVARRLGADSNEEDRGQEEAAVSYRTRSKSKSRGPSPVPELPARDRRPGPPKTPSKPAAPKTPAKAAAPKTPAKPAAPKKPVVLPESGLSDPDSDEEPEEPVVPVSGRTRNARSGSRPPPATPAAAAPVAASGRASRSKTPASTTRATGRASTGPTAVPRVERQGAQPAGAAKAAAARLRDQQGAAQPTAAAAVAADAAVASTSTPAPKRTTRGRPPKQATPSAAAADDDGDDQFSRRKRGRTAVAAPRRSTAAAPVPEQQQQPAADEEQPQDALPTAAVAAAAADPAADDEEGPEMAGPSKKRLARMGASGSGAPVPLDVPPAAPAAAAASTPAATAAEAAVKEKEKEKEEEAVQKVPEEEQPEHLNDDDDGGMRIDEGGEEKETTPTVAVEPMETATPVEVPDEQVPLAKGGDESEEAAKDTAAPVEVPDEQVPAAKDGDEGEEAAKETAAVETMEEEKEEEEAPLPADDAVVPPVDDAAATDDKEVPPQGDDEVVPGSCIVEEGEGEGEESSEQRKEQQAPLAPLVLSMDSEDYDDVGLMIDDGSSPSTRSATPTSSTTAAEDAVEEQQAAAPQVPPPAAAAKEPTSKSTSSRDARSEEDEWPVNPLEQTASTSRAPKPPKMVPAVRAAKTVVAAHATRVAAATADTATASKATTSSSASSSSSSVVPERPTVAAPIALSLEEKKKATIQALSTSQTSARGGAAAAARGGARGGGALAAARNTTGSGSSHMAMNARIAQMGKNIRKGQPALSGTRRVTQPAPAARAAAVAAAEPVVAAPAAPAAPAAAKRIAATAGRMLAPPPKPKQISEPRPLKRKANFAMPAVQAVAVRAPKSRVSKSNVGPSPHSAESRLISTVKAVCEDKETIEKAIQQMDISRLTLETIVKSLLTALLELPQAHLWHVVMATMQLGKEELEANRNKVIPKAERNLFQLMEKMQVMEEDKEEKIDEKRNLKNRLFGLFDKFYEEYSRYLMSPPVLTSSNSTTGDVTRNVRCAFLALWNNNMLTDEKEDAARKFFHNIMMHKSSQAVCQSLVYLLCQKNTVELASHILSMELDDDGDSGRLISLHMSSAKEADAVRWAVDSFAHSCSNNENAAYKTPATPEMVQQWWEEDMGFVERARDQPEAATLSPGKYKIFLFDQMTKSIMARMATLISPVFRVEGLDRVHLLQQLDTPAFDALDRATTSEVEVREVLFADTSSADRTLLTTGDVRVLVIKLYTAMDALKHFYSDQMPCAGQRESLRHHLLASIERVHEMQQRPAAVDNDVLLPSSEEEAEHKEALELLLLAVKTWMSAVQHLTRRDLKGTPAGSSAESSPVKKRARSEEYDNDQPSSSNQ